MPNISVFLGGTCADSTWRNELQTLLNSRVDAFNPVTDDWNVASQLIEDQHRADDDFCLYGLTPAAESTYSLVEATDDSNKRPDRTLVVVLYEDKGRTRTLHQAKVLQKSMKLWVSNGAQVFTSLQEVADFFNQQTIK